MAFCQVDNRINDKHSLADHIRERLYVDAVLDPALAGGHKGIAVETGQDIICEGYNPRQAPVVFHQ